MDFRGPLQQAMFARGPANHLLVMLHSVERLKFSEIARKLQASESSVKTRYYRSLQKLSATLKQDQKFSGK